MIPAGHVPVKELCLECPLNDCNEGDPGCLIWKDKLKPTQLYYRKMKNDSEFRRKRAKIKKAWRKTEAGRESIRKTAARWREKNPEKARVIWKNYHEANKKKRLAAARDYKRKIRRERNDSQKPD